MFGTVNGVSNNLALEKIYCMLILRIRDAWPPELWVTGNPGPTSSYAPGTQATRS